MKIVMSAFVICNYLRFDCFRLWFCFSQVSVKVLQLEEEPQATGSSLSQVLGGVGGFWWHNTEGHLQLVIFLIKNCRFTFSRASIKDAQATVLKMPLHLFSIFVGNILPFCTRIRILNTASYCNLCSWSQTFWGWSGSLDPLSEIWIFLHNLNCI